MPDCVIQAEHVTYAYPCGKPGLRALSLNIRRRRKLAIVGPNGAGKTTLILCLNGTYRPQSGAIRLNGAPTGYRRDALLAWRQHVGVVFQDPDDQVVAPSVAQDVAFGPLNMGLTPEAARERASECLTALGIECLWDAGTHELSHGQRKLVALAGVLAMRPDVILLDEPTAGLDPAGRRRVLAVLDQLHAGGTTLAMATHDMDLVYAWADDVAVLRDGQTLLEGTTESVFRDASVLDAAGLEVPCVPAVARQLHRLNVLPTVSTARTAEGLLMELNRSGCAAAAAGEAPLAEPLAVTDAAELEVPAPVSPPRQAILLVAFGTSIPEAESAYDVIERLCRDRFPGAEVRWAFTARFIRSKLAAQGRHLEAPGQALERLVNDGYLHVAVQSLHVIRGQEYDEMSAELDEVRTRRQEFRSVVVGLPLLSSQADIRRVAQAMTLRLAPADREPGDAMVWMGHGSRHHAEDARYDALAEALRLLDPHTFLATVEGHATLDAMLAGIRQSGARKAWLLPFMAVAGDHARNDLAGEEPDSWKSVLEAAGIPCLPVLKGMAEYPAIAEIWMDHLAAAWRESE
jgi:cobalt/nickel transport system ATP-binding protein